MGHFRDRRAFGNVGTRRFRGARYGDGKSPRFTGLLDLYGGASAAYSLRALSRGWLAGDVVEVRRSSDSATADFTASQITSGALVTWVGAGNDGFVSTWYDQSGNASDMTQETTTSQPKIVDAGALVANGIDFYSNSILESAAFADGTSSSVFMAFNNQAADANRKIFFSKSTFPDYGVIFNYRGDNSVGQYDFVNFDGFNHALTYSEATSPLLGISTTIINGTGKEAFLNGTSRASDAETFVGANEVLRLGNGSFGTGFEIAEVILYPTDETANRVGIETNINDYYSIY